MGRGVEVTFDVVVGRESQSLLCWNPGNFVSQFQQVLLRPKFIFDSASDLVLSLIGTIIDIFISICQYFISIWSVFVNFIK